MKGIFTLTDASKKHLIVPPNDREWSGDTLTIGNTLDPKMSVDDGRLKITTTDRKINESSLPPINAGIPELLKKEVQLPG